MKNYKSKILIGIALIALFTACRKTENFPVTKVGISYVFDPRDSAGTNARLYLLNIYSVVQYGHSRVNSDYLDAASDDAVSSVSGGDVQLISTGSYTSLDLPAAENVWSTTNSNNTGNMWNGIRAATEFINNIPVVPVLGSTNGVPTRYVWQAEARFLRAYFYFELVKRYGGVPLLGNKVYNINDNLAIPRSSFSDCINYIVSECDSVKDKLITAPLTNPTGDNYRVTKGAALALKARVLLYAASPLFNDPSGSNSNPLTGYTSYNVTRWAQAATAAKDLINLGAYQLDSTYKDIFLSQNNVELIMIRPGNKGTSIEAANGPVGFPSALANGRTSPTQQLVDAYPMGNGKAITDPTSGYNPLSPYTKRDPRLNENVLHNGSQWLNTFLQTYEGGQSKPNNGQTQTVTGYYMNKFMGIDSIGTSFQPHVEDWVIFRYAEVLLNYAEAENESVPTPTGDIYAQLEQLRKRAKIPAGDDGLYGLTANMTQTQMRAAIQNERRIEMPFEEQRYFDIRRWKIAETVMNQPLMGVSIDNANGTLTYNYVPVLQPKFIAPKMYLYPIPYDEVQKNPSIKQNPGW